MVRFIILSIAFLQKNFASIYIPLWLDLLYIDFQREANEKNYLHSTMVRFIIGVYAIKGDDYIAFTFHYG